MAFALAGLVAGLVAGLYRIGAVEGALPSDLAPLHGPLMVCSFLGTVISLERAVALGRRWAWAPVFLVLLGTAATLAAPWPWLGPLLLTVAGGLLTAVYGGVLRRQRSTETLIMAGGAVLWTVGNLLWASGAPTLETTPWWMGFLVMTIAGERLELSRLRPRPPWANTALLWTLVTFMGALAALHRWPEVASRVAGLALAGAAVWLLVFDIARRTVRAAGQVRFVAVALLAGFGWLLLGGVQLALIGDLAGGPLRDAALHAVFVGFVISMIFGHAHIVGPAVFRVTLPWSRWFYLPLGLLHLSMAVRTVGDLGAIDPLRVAGAWGTTAAIGVFLLTLLGHLWAARRSRGSRGA